MNFTQLSFWAFIVTCFGVYWLVKKQVWQNAILLIGSLIFYASFDFSYTFLLIVSIAIDYWISIRFLKDNAHKKNLLILSLFVNIGIWIFFKYSQPLLSIFFNIQNFQTSGFAGTGFSLIIPIGLSFFTLKKIAYIIDLFRGQMKPCTNFIEYATFIAFFPQIIAGPIDRAQNLIPQFQVSRKWQSVIFLDAWPLLLTGLFKKMVIADGVGIIVDQVYLSQSPSKLLWLAGTLGFITQLLADFSGYTDISRGIARLFGIETPINFNAPYLSLNINEFWNRWHITLSEWFKTYIFFPIRRWLLKQRKNNSDALALILPPLMTMLISGLWHGTGLNFIFWGLAHGIMIAIYQIRTKSTKTTKSSRINILLSWLFTLIFLIFSWGLFRTSSLEWMGDVLIKSPFVNGMEDLSIVLSIFSFVLFYTTLYLVEFSVHRWTGKTAWIRSFFYSAITIMIFIYSNSISPDFIYTHF